MPKCPPVSLKRSFITLAILSASACSNLPLSPNSIFSGVGNEKANDGKATAVTNTRYTAATNILPAELVPLIRIQDSHTPSAIQTAAVAATRSRETPTKDIIPRVSLDQSDEEQSPKTQGTLHEVVRGENLWQIAKKTTGDAMNWHALVDINDLQPNGNVYPGEMLLIPAKLVAKNTNANIEQNNATVSNQTIAFQVGSGESLWKLTKRTTGDATNWQTIARHNNFTEKESTTIYLGQTIYVPKSLIETSDEDAISLKPITDQVTPSITTELSFAVTMTEQTLNTALPEASQELAKPQQQVALDTIADNKNEIDYNSLTDQSHAMAIMRAHYGTDDIFKPVATAQNTETKTIEENINAPW